VYKFIYVVLAIRLNVKNDHLKGEIDGKEEKSSKEKSSKEENRKEENQKEKIKLATW
jgi:hypothetical protein